MPPGPSKPYMAKQACAQVAIRPFLLACESKSSKLVAIALVSMHKLVSTNSLPVEEAMAMLKALEQVGAPHPARLAGQPLLDVRAGGCQVLCWWAVQTGRCIWCAGGEDA